MSMKVKYTESPELEPMPVGTYGAVIKDITMHEQQSGGKYANDEPQVKIVLVVKKVIDATSNPRTRENPNPKAADFWLDKEVWAFCPFNPKTRNKSGEWIRNILGYEPDLDGDFDWHDLLGRKVKVGVGRSNTGKHKVISLVRVEEARASQLAATPAPQSTLPANDDNDLLGAGDDWGDTSSEEVPF